MKKEMCAPFVPQTGEEQAAMLASVGIESAESLFSSIPEEARVPLPELPAPMSEMELSAHLSALAGKNRPAGCRPSFLGAGVYDHFVPAAVGEITSRQEFYTAYTPYQPEISQGTLTAIFEYQTMVASLTGLPVANASMYDVATAAAEAMRMASAQTRRKAVAVSGAVHPHVRQTIASYAHFAGIEVVTLPFDRESGRTADAGLEEVAAVILQTPNFFGILEDGAAWAEKAHAAGALAVCVGDPMAMSLLRSPGEMGFDIAVGEVQPLGQKMSFGGPYAGFMAAADKLTRKLPGRIVGQTTDNRGQRAFVLTLQAREQHIRREKATSNICSNQALCALAATVYLSLAGPEGLREAASLSAQKAAYLRDKLIASGKFEQVFNGKYFREFVVKPKGSLKAVETAVRDAGFVGGYDLGRDFPELAGCWMLAVTEKRTRAEMDEFVKKAVSAL